LRGCFAVSVDDGSEIESPIIDAHAIPCGVWVGGRLAVYVFTLGSHYLVRTTLVGDDDDDDVTCTVAIRPSSDGVTVNGQCMRVHQALPPSQSLLFVVGDSGCVLSACRECGNVACAADAPPGSLPPVAYASDESSEDDEEEDHPMGLGLGPILRSSRNSSCNIDSGHLIPRPQSPPPIAVQSVLRQRSGHVSMQRTSMESSSTLDDKSGGTSLAARAALALVSLAMLLPVRRLVIGGNTTTVGRWLSARTNTLPPMDYGGPRKSVLALIVLVLTAAVAVALGVALAERCW
ncbi:hypothetical protein GGH13_009875, partial [Coemansia sp. S155-1]